MRILGLLVGLIILTCSKPNLANILVNKIELFEKYENIYFKNISITRLSRELNQRSPMEFEIRKKGRPSFAVIQTKPEIRILKNYYSDTLTIDFVKAFSELDLTGLHNYNENQNDTLFQMPITHLEFRSGKENIMLFRNNPYQTKEFAQVIVDKSIPIEGNWKYAVFHVNPH